MLREERKWCQVEVLIYTKEWRAQKMKTTQVKYVRLFFPVTQISLKEDWLNNSNTDALWVYNICICELYNKSGIKT